MNEELKKIIAIELEVSADELTRDKVLADFDVWDSVVALSLMVILGEELGVPVTPNEIRNLKTFGDIEQLVVNKKPS
jgi:acyl carrier protein